MKFELDEITAGVKDEMERFSAERLKRMGEFAATDHSSWKELAEFGLLSGQADGLRSIDTVVGMIAGAQGGLPGPILEAELACATGCEAALAAIREGRIVSSIAPGLPQPVIVGWGAVAHLVIDQATGAVLADSPLSPVETALPMAHGVIERTGGSGEDPLLARRWMLGSALLVGLGYGALTLATDYVSTRTQFGRTLSSFQAVQFRLAECVVKLDAAELMVIDAARRDDAGDVTALEAAALAWLYTSRALAIIEKHVHQVFGAIGFTEELGIIRLTYQSAWIRTSVGQDAVTSTVLGRRDIRSAVPASIVYGGYGPSADQHPVSQVSPFASAALR